MTLLLLLAPSLALAGQLTPLHEGPIPGDGTSTVTLLVHAPGARMGDKLKVRSNTVVVESAEVLPYDRLRFSFIPPEVSQPEDLSFDVKIKGDGIDTEESISVPLVPQVSGALSLNMDPPLTASGGAEVTIRASFQGNPHLEPEAREVAFSASAGTMSAPTFDGTSWVARYTPPADLDEPVAAVITAIDLSAPEQIIGGGTLPVSVTRSKSFLEDPGSENVLKAGGKDYGPITAGADGKFSVDLELTPGLNSLSLTTTSGGTPRTREVSLDNGATAQIAFAPLPEGVVLPAGEPRTAWLYAADAAGAPRVSAGVTVEGPGRTRVEDAGEGWYRVGFQPEAGQDWTLTATLDGESVSLSGVGAGPLPNLALTPESELLSGDEETLTVRLRAKDDEGTALPGLALNLRAAGAAPPKQKGELVDGEDGTYERPFEVEDDTAAVLLFASPSPAPSSLPPVQLRIWSALDELPSDGSNIGRVWVVAEDAYGQPVPGVEVGLAVPYGDGSLPPKVTTGDDGMGYAAFTAGTATTPTILRARAGSLQAAGLLWQGVPRPEALPGSPAVVAEADKWRGATPAVRVGRVPLKAFDPTEPAVLAAQSAANDPASAAPAVEPDELSMLEVRLSGLYLSYTYSAVAEDEEELTDPTAAFGGGGATPIFGAGAEAEYFYDRWFVGVDARARFGSYAVATGDDTFNDSLNRWYIGARGRWPIPTLEFLRPELGFGYQGSNALVFVFTDDTRTTRDIANDSFSGWRTSLGLAADAGPVEISAEGATTIGLEEGRWTEALLGAEIEVWNGVHAGLRVEGDWRTVAVDADGVDVEVTDSQLGGRLLVGYRL